MAILRLKKSKEITEKKGNIIFRIPYRVYSRQSFNMVIGIFLITLLFRFDLEYGIDTIFPDKVLIIILGLFSGMFVFCLLRYVATPVGFYDNGILNHSSFIEYSGINYYEILDENSLNKRNNYKTLSFVLNNFTEENVEFDIRDKDIIQNILLKYGINEKILNDDKLSKEKV